jgi:uncharacterized repeat protein (TIGR02059 family)
VKNRLIAKVSIFVLIFSFTNLLNISVSERAFAATAGSGNCVQTVNNASGVAVYEAAGYCYVAFKDVGSRIWTVPSNALSMDYLVVAGGGGGGGHHSGGGGAGGLRQAQSFSLAGKTEFTITVGDGGAGGVQTSGSAYSKGSIGSNSSLVQSSGTGSLNISATGGGGGATLTSPNNATSGGSGGGNFQNIVAAGNAGGFSPVEGYAGGVGTNSDSAWSAGGGGGAGEVGKNSTTAGIGGAGGAGQIISWISTTARINLLVGQEVSSAVYFAGGGGGGATNNGTNATGGAGGRGGGGAGTGNATSALTAVGGAGTSNSGGGGGGSGEGRDAVAGTNHAGGKGGSGVVLIRYIIPIDTTAPTFSSAVLNSAGTQITLTYNETLSATTAATSAFAVSDSGTAVSVSSVSASGFSVTLALASTINIGRVVTVSYTDPTAGDDASAIQDSVGNDAISLVSRSVTNNSTVKSTPTFSTWTNVTKTFGDANYTVTAPTVTGSIPGSFSYSSNNTGVISISGTTFTVQGGGSATITATFTPTDAANYNSATTTNTVTVNKASQTAITITTTTASYGTNLTLASTGGSTGGTYTYTKVSGNCTLAGAVLTPTATGSCVVQSSLETTANYLAETSTATTITISSGSASASLTLEPGNLIFRQAKNITAVATVAGKITFRVAGKVLPGCKNKRVSAGNSFTAICSYRPSNHSYVTISATLDPIDSFYVGTVTNSAQYLVTKRTGARS